MTCKYGHDSPRYKSGNCIECERLRSKRRWEEDKEALKARNASYRAVNKEELRRRGKEWRDANKDIVKARNAASYAKNAEKRRAYAAAYRLAHPGFVEKNNQKWYSENRERALAYARNRWIENPDAIRVSKHKRRARMLSAAGTHTASDIRDIARRQRYKCAYCKCSVKDDYHVDHIIPLKLGGTNFRNNLQILCQSCNHRKSAKHPLEFARQLGRLL